MGLLRLFQEKKYLLRIFLWITCSILLIVFSFSALIYVNVEKNVFRSEYENSQKVLSQMKFNIDYLDTMVRNLVLSTYGSNDVKALMYLVDEETYDHMSTINKLNATLVANYPFIQSIYIYNNHKKVYYSTSGDLYKKDPELDRALASYDHVPALKAIVRPMRTDGVQPHEDTVLSYVMYETTDDEGRMDGAVILNAKLDWLVDNIRTINQIDSRAHSDLYILDSNRGLMETNPGESVGGSPFAKAIQSAFKSSIPPEKEQADEPSGFFRTSVDGEKYIVSYIYLANTGWTILEAKPYKEAYANLKQLLDTILLIAGAVFVGALLLTLSVSQGIYRPVRRLMEQTSGAGSAGGGAAAPLRAKDEFAYLTEVYRQSREQLYQYNLEINTNATIMKLYFLKKLLADSRAMSAAEFEDVLKQLNGALRPEGPFLLCVLRIDEYKRFLGERSLAERELLRFAIANVTTDVLSQAFVAETVDMRDDSFTVLLSPLSGGDAGEADASDASDAAGARGAASTAALLAQLERLLREAQAYVRQHYHVSFSAAASHPIREYASIAAAYGQVLANSSYRYVFGAMSVLTQPFVEENTGLADLEQVMALESRFIEALPKGDPAKTEERLRELFANIRKLEYGDMMMVSMQVVHHLKKTIYEMNRTSKEPIAIHARLQSRELYEEETIDAFERLLLEAVAAAGGGAKATASQGSQMAADAIRDIVESSYFDSALSAAGIAEMLRLSAYKLSKIAKEHFGMSIPEYINQVRLRKAVEWMENSKLSIQEIMRRVGVENESYFYKLFKAQYGTTPREYIASRTR